MIDFIDQIIPIMIDRDLIVPITMYGLHICKRRKGETARVKAIHKPSVANAQLRVGNFSPINSLAL